LLGRLRAFSLAPDDQLIRDFRAYVAATTYNACNSYIRRKFPARARLKNRTRYSLSHHRDFEIWQREDDIWICGLRSSRRREQNVQRHTLQLQRLIAEPDEKQRALRPLDFQRSQLSDLLRRIFQYAGGPVYFDDLVQLIAELQGLRESVSSIDESQQPLAEQMSNPFDTAVERRSYLKRLWDEITQLPPLQRAALLLNLRQDQEGVISLLPFAGIASVRQIAGAVGMPIDEFASLWNELPLDDSTIAHRLNVTRQQVINLRKSARARLGRRMNLRDETRNK